MSRRPAMILALLLVASACGNSTADVPPQETSSTFSPSTVLTPTTPSTNGPTTTTGSPTTVPSTTTTTVAVPVYALSPLGTELPTVELLDAGSEPRAVLEFSPMPGDVVHTEVVLTFSTAQEFNGAEPVGSDLTVRIGSRNTVLEINEDGFVTEDTAISAEVESSNPDVIAALEPLYAFLPGLSTYSQVAPSGAHLAEDNSQMVSFIDASGQDLAFSPGELISPFPAEEVGVGARWVVTALIVEEFVAVEQRTIYELVDRDGDVVTLAIELEQTLINPESLGVGLENPSTEYVATGSGRILIDLTFVSPIESSLMLTQRIVIQGEADGQDISVITTNEVTTTSRTISLTRG